MPGLCANDLEGGSQDDSHQQQCSRGRMFPNMSATSICIPKVSPTYLGDCPRAADRSGPGSYQITAFALGPGACEVLCVPFKSEVSIYPSPLGLPKLGPAGLQSQMLWGLVLLMQDPWVAEPYVGLRILTPVGEPLQCNYTPVCGSPTQGYGT